MLGDGSAATVMLGLPGFRLLAVSDFYGELEQAVETMLVEDFCRGCGVVARLHNRRPTWVRDLPAGEAVRELNVPVIAPEKVMGVTVPPPAMVSTPAVRAGGRLSRVAPGRGT